MSYYQDDKHVISGIGVVIWDGITRPETKDGGVVVHSLRIALPPSMPEIAELDTIARKALDSSEFKGVMPNGGRWPLAQLGPDVDPSLNGYTAFNSTTQLGCPQVYDINGRVLNPVEYGSMLYPGAKVKVVVHAFSYNNKNKGISFGLDGVQIVDATAPKLAIAGGIDVAGAFGGGSAPAPGVPAPPPAPGVPAPSPAPGVVPAPDFLNGPGAQAPAPPAKKMTAKAVAAGYTYDFLKANNWTDAQMIAQGYLEDDIPY